MKNKSSMFRTCAGQEDELRKLECAWKFAQTTCRETASVVKRTLGVEQDNIQLSLQLEMLKAIIKNPM